jgi:hypothetical protein
MTYDDITPTMRAFLGGWEAFRKLGFRASDLFCEIAMSAQSGSLSCFVTLKTQNKRFSLEVGAVTDPKAFGDEYERVCRAVNAKEVPQADLDRIWRESEAYERRVDFAAAITLKGFVLPEEIS